VVFGGILVVLGGILVVLGGIFMIFIYLIRNVKYYIIRCIYDIIVFNT
jgi:hypothetical protein